MTTDEASALLTAEGFSAGDSTADHPKRAAIKQALAVLSAAALPAPAAPKPPAPPPVKGKPRTVADMKKAKK